MKDWLAEMNALRSLTLRQVRARYGAAPRWLERGASYGRMTGLTEFHHGAASPLHLYFATDDADATPLLLYLEPPAELAPAHLAAALGEPERRLASRAGKRFRHCVHPAQGFAYSADNKRVAYLEAFAPTMLESYLARFYVEPDAFIE